MRAVQAASVILGLASSAAANLIQRSATVDSCPGYKVQNAKTVGGSVTATLVLAGPACNVYGPDLQKLNLAVTYENENRIHVKITDANSQRYEVPTSVFTRPTISSSITGNNADIKFTYTSSPFTFKISRSSTGEVLFDSSAGALVFEPQYLRLKTKLPSQANIYGLGEHSDPFRLDPTNTTRTFWNRDAYGIPQGAPLYGTHPVYFEHRTTGTHGVLFMTSNGMDVNLANGSLGYNAIGGVFDFYFFAGPTPVNVAQQYAALVGLPAEVPYWGLGFHQCRYGYTDYVDVSQVITNYSAAGIPLETMWTDIDYMYKRWTFTNDPQYFPTEKMQEIVNYLHSHDQQYILMIDPAVAYQPNQNYIAYDTGTEMGVFLKYPNGTLFEGVVWPGPTVFPDWFHPNATAYWSGQITRFFNKNTGIDLDGLWIDMNEAANFCDYPCSDPAGFAAANGDPPTRPGPAPTPGTPIFQRRALDLSGTTSNSTSGTPNPLNPPYAIHDSLPELSDRAIDVSVVHANGLLEYDVHNVYGTMMSFITQQGMSDRRPGLRTLIITRSTFVGAGKKVGKWLGDNLSDWDHYRWSIAGQLGMASLYQVPMVGSDICGFGGDTTETLCARWARLGAFSPFMRNHNQDNSISQEFYRWNMTAVAATKAINLRYQLLDYIYTHFHRQSVDGTPLIGPMWFHYPQDAATFPIDLQFFYGDYILVSPVTQGNSTSVDIYLPKDTFYDLTTYAPVQGKGATVSLTNVDFTDIPLHIRGGGVLPMRVEGAMTIKALRTKDFQLVVAPDATGAATGLLYIDDGLSVTQMTETSVSFTFAHGVLTAKGTFAFNVGSVQVAKVLFLGVSTAPKSVSVTGGKSLGFIYQPTTKVVTVNVEIPLTKTSGFSVTMK
ncbi:hypothetical protein FRB95_008575 [Tulasnella sp. JGI-2019a]|nr:hypothetical protein FRB95_008575 [Tulasnella sp. JGI-2019a]